MRFSVSKLVIIFGTPIVLMGYQNCAKLGTESLLGQSSVFVAQDSIELSSTGTSTSAELLAETKQSCFQVTPAQEAEIQSCMNLFCNQLDQNQPQKTRNLHLCQKLQRLTLAL